MSNTLKNKYNSDYHAIKLESSNFKTKVGDVIGSSLILDGFGYQEVILANHQKGLIISDFSEADQALFE